MFIELHTETLAECLVTASLILDEAMPIPTDEMLSIPRGCNVITANGRTRGKEQGKRILNLGINRGKESGWHLYYNIEPA